MSQILKNSSDDTKRRKDQLCELCDSLSSQIKQDPHNDDLKDQLVAVEIELQKIFFPSVNHL